jgi:negative regulator of flagellin synthesis FlgM
MNIDSERSPVNLEAYIKSSQESEGVSQSLRHEKQGASPTESVKLSHTAKEIQKIREIVEATPEIRTDKVGQLKREIETGTYSVNADKVAERMLRESLIDTFI